MDISKMKEAVITAGKRLVDEGLIARTWGNVSCRVNKKQFLITPSGRAYETLTPGEIVTVNIDDCSHEGTVEPSSEKGVHAEVYRQRADVNFIIHTHQPYASALSPLNSDIEVPDQAVAALLGSKVVSIAYGLSGKKKLRKNVADALAREKVKAYLMASHGALCLGEDAEDTFQVASALEEVCAGHIKQRYLELSGRDYFNPDQFKAYILKHYSGSVDADYAPVAAKMGNSERTAGGFKLEMDAPEGDPFPVEGAKRVLLNLTGEQVGPVSETSLPAAAIHRELYRSYPGINNIIHIVSPDILLVSQIGGTLYPFLDDFAQIIGTSVPIVNISESGSREIARKIKGRNAVLINNSGALCCGPTESDARAAVMILEKNCKARIASMLFGHGKAINFLECHLMRYVYLKRYSKKALHL